MDDLKFKVKGMKRILHMKSGKWRSTVMASIIALAFVGLLVLSLSFSSQSLLLQPSKASADGANNAETGKQMGMTSDDGSSSLTTQAASVVIDGVIQDGEYQVKATMEYTFRHGRWYKFYMYYTIDRVNGELYMALYATDFGWVGIAFDWSESNRDNTDVILGYYSGGTTTISDDHGDLKENHTPDVDLGGTDDILAAAASENSTGTILEFKRKLDTGDTYDFAIAPGITTGLM